MLSCKMFIFGLTIFSLYFIAVLARLEVENGSLTYDCFPDFVKVNFTHLPQEDVQLIYTGVNKPECRKSFYANQEPTISINFKNCTSEKKQFELWIEEYRFVDRYNAVYPVSINCENLEYELENEG